MGPSSVNPARVRARMGVRTRSACLLVSRRGGYERNGPLTSYVIPADELPLVPRWLEK